MSRGAYAGGGSAIRLRKEWLEPLQGEFDAPYMRLLSDFLRAQKAEGKVIFPPGGEIFQALELTPPEAVRVVILGQDPYHGPGQAHGLSFSVREGVPIPPRSPGTWESGRPHMAIWSPGRNKASCCSIP